MTDVSMLGALLAGLVSFLSPCVLPLVPGYDLFVVNPLPRTSGSSSFMTLSNSGVSRYHEFQATLHFQPVRQGDLNLSYIWSLNRGDLNTSSDIFVPFEQPVICPNAFSIASSDVPNRFVAWGLLHLPWKTTLSAVIDVHTGLPYSNVDVLQNYAGKPDGQRFPTFFSLDTKIYRDFHLPLPGVNEPVPGRASRFHSGCPADAKFGSVCIP